VVKVSDSAQYRQSKCSLTYALINRMDETMKIVIAIILYLVCLSNVFAADYDTISLGDKYYLHRTIGADVAVVVQEKFKNNKIKVRDINNADTYVVNASELVTRSESGKQVIEDAVRTYKFLDNLAEPNKQKVIAYRDRAVSKNNQGDYTGARDDLTKAIELDPQYGSAYYLRGRCNLSLEKYDLALMDFEKAIQLDPTFAPPYYYRGVTKEIFGYYYAARSDYVDAKKLGQKDVDSSIERLKAYQ